MILRSRRIAILVAVGLTLCGCGSTNKVDAMAKVLTTYNESRQRDLAEAGAACKKASDDLRATGAAQALASPNARNGETVRDLEQAVRSAQTGFADCARAAETLDYGLMVQATSEINAANASIERLRRPGR